MTPFNRQLEHLTTLGKHPGSKDHAWHRAKELEADPSGLWQGITQALTAAVNGPEKTGESAPQTLTKRR
jgi:hypothetical protein